MAIRTGRGKSEVKIIRVRDNGRVDAQRVSDGTIFPNANPDLYEADGGWAEIQGAMIVAMTHKQKTVYWAKVQEMAIRDIEVERGK